MAGVGRTRFATRRWRRRLATAALAVGLGAPVAACSTVHESLGTSDAPCFVALPTAAQAVGRSAHLVGVRLYKVSSVVFPRLDSALRAAGLTSGRVCLVAFRGHFSASSVGHPSGRPSGSFAVVVLRYPSGSLVATVLFRRVPVPFGHSHLG